MSKKLVRTSTLSEQLFEILKDDLLDGKYVPGQKLPSESSLASTYGVSRLTARAAIARLSALGFIETRFGEGSFVVERNEDEFLQNVSAVLVKPQMLSDVTAFRKLIDIECARLCIVNATDDEILDLAAASQKFSDFLDSISALDEQAQRTIVDLDFNFHLKICELSGNTLYPLVYKAAQEAIKQQICTNVVSRWHFNRLDAADPSSIEPFKQGHSNLVKSIQERDFKKAKRYTIMHIDYNIMKIPDA